MVIEGLRRVFDSAGEFELVRWASSYAEAQAALVELRPQLLLIDQSAGLKSTFRFLTEIREVCPTSYPVLWVTELAEVDCFRALQMGARGIAKRSLPVEEFLDCLRTVARGSIWLESNTPPPDTAGYPRRQSPRLTPREREIVGCLCRGLRNKEIAQELSITPGTVKVHLMHIFEKTGVKDRFELAVHGRQLLGGAEDGLGDHGVPIA
jgi:DNA-binding NarL/FixJ family response regulator